MKRIYSYIAALLMLSLMASQVHAKEQVTQSDISGSAKEKWLVVNKLMIRLKLIYKDIWKE